MGPSSYVYSSSTAQSYNTQLNFHINYMLLEDWKYPSEHIAIYFIMTKGMPLTPPFWIWSQQKLWETILTTAHEYF